MKLYRNAWFHALEGLLAVMAASAFASIVFAQGLATTTVQGTIYLANGQPGAGTLQVSWPAFTTAANQAVAAGRMTTSIGTDGFVSVNLAPNLGASPAGLFYTAVYNMSDGTANTEYWVVPAAAQTTIASVRAQVMPAAQAVQAVNKAYVDQAIQSVSQSSLSPSGGTLTGPLYLSGDPTQAMQASDKHYVDSTFNQAVPLTGAALTGPLTSVQLGAAYQVDQFAGVDFGAKLQACLGAVSPANGGTCDARNFTGSQSMASNLAISTANTTILLPCATIATASQLIVTAGTRNVSLRGCALRGASAASGSQGGTVFLYSGSGSMFQVGDPTYASDTPGFHLDNVVVNTTGSSNPTAQGLVAYRTQELDLQSLYFLGNSNQTGMTLDGTGNYTGGTFYDNAFDGFATAVNAIGHQANNSATTDWVNASTFVRLHIDCPTNNGTPIAGTYGINLQQGDGNTFTGGDVEGCSTALHLGPNAQNNTIIGLRNENSSSQVIADTGSAYNNWITGGTMFTGQLTDNGTRNSFLDTFHRSFNGVAGDWYGSQQDATVTNHYRLGIGKGNERGLYDRYQTDSGYRWTMGLSDATAGEQFYQVLDELNNVYRISIGQYNNSQSSTNNQTVVNAAGTGAVVLNGSNNSGTGGVVFGSGGPSETTVATVNNAGNAQFNGTLQVGGTSTFTGSTTVRNQADAEIDSFLWAGAAVNQKESYTYKDFTGASQWYMVKDASNNWALNSAPGGLDSFKAYQSTNSGDTYINASNSSGVVRVNYETGSGTQFKIYGGNSGTPYASFTGATSIQFPGLAAGGGHNCLQVDNSGYLSNTGSACGSGTGTNGTVNSGTSGQIAYYSSGGTTLSGMTTIPLSAGGTGATTAAAALAALGGASLAATASQSFSGPVSVPSVTASVNSQINVMASPYDAKGDCVTDDHNAIQAAINAAGASSNPPAAVYFPKPPGGCYLTSTLVWNGASLQGQPGLGTSVSNSAGVSIQGKPGADVLNVPSPSSVSTAAPNRTWSIRDLRFVVDDSAPGNFPDRWPGRWISDAAMTAGSAIFTSSNSMISCGDIGQAILIKGAGPSGSDLSTTIAAVAPCWATSHQPTSQIVTLASAASTSVTGDLAYISVGNLPVTANVGACGIAFDDVDGNQADNTMTGPVGNLYDSIRDVSFSSVGGGFGKNSTCAVYFEGQWGPYGVDARNVNIGGVYYGVVQSSSDTNPFGSNGGNDFQKWDHGLWQATYPWISYNGAYNKIEDVQLNSSFGPQILQYANTNVDTAIGWTINVPEFSHPSGVTLAWRIEGSGHVLTNSNLALDYSGGQSVLFDANESQCVNCNIIGNMTINGSHNRFTLTSDSAYEHFTDVGVGNVITGSYHVSPAYGYPDSRFSAINVSRGDRPAGTMTSDFIRTGNVATPYMSDQDLMFWPDDFAMNSSSFPPSVSPDANSLTGKYIAWYQDLIVNKFTNAAYLNNSGTALIGSKMVPATQATVSISAACPSVQSFTLTVLSGSVAIASGRFPCTPAYAASSLPVNMASYSGGALGFSISGAGSSGPASGVNVAYISLSPYNASLSMSGPINFGNSGAASSTLTNLGGQQAMAGVASDGANGITVTGAVHGKNIVINPLQYGAQCNGSDDSTYVQNALNALTPGSILEFTCMAYVGHTGWAGLTIPVSNVTIRAAHGAGLTVLAAPSQTILGNIAPSIVLFANGQSHVLIDGLEINGGGFNTGLIGLQTCTYCKVERTYLHNSAGIYNVSANGISAVGGSYNTLLDNVITGTGRDMWIGNAVSGEQEDHDIISENEITACNASGIAYNGSHGRITSNVSSSNTGGSGVALSSASGAIQYETMVIGNILRYNGFQGVQADVSGGAAYSAQNVSIIGNDASYNSGAGIYAANVNGWTIANNTVKDNGQGGSTVQGIVLGPTAQNVVVSGNTLGDDQATHTQTASIDANAQNTANGLLNIVIANNVSSYGAGVQVFQGGASGSGTGISILGNSITGAPGYGIQQDPGFTGVNISNNNVSGSGTSDIRNDGNSVNTVGGGNTYTTSTGYVPVPVAGGITGTPNVVLGQTQMSQCSVGTTAQSGYTCYIYSGNSANHMLWMNYSSVPNSGVFPFALGWGGVPAFYVKGIGSSAVEVAVNNGQILNGYSGNQSTVKWFLKAADGSASLAAGNWTMDANGNAHHSGTAPTVNSGTLTGTNAGGYITGLSAVSSVTITFANSGWNTWASCTANATVNGSQPYVSSTLGLKTGVTFSFPASFTGGITYSCTGN